MILGGSWNVSLIGVPHFILEQQQQNLNEWTESVQSRLDGNSNNPRSVYRKTGVSDKSPSFLLGRKWMIMIINTSFPGLLGELNEKIILWLLVSTQYTVSAS